MYLFVTSMKLKLQILLGAFLFFIASQTLAVGKNKTMNTDFELKYKETKKLSDGLSVTFSHYSVEEIAEHSENTQSYPAGSGINLTLTVQKGDQKSTITFSQFSEVYGKKSTQKWNNYDFYLKKIDMENVKIIKVHFRIESVGAKHLVNLAKEFVQLEKDPNSKRNVDFYFQDLSGFFLNGESLWVCKDGFAVLQVVGKAPSPRGHALYYRFQLSKSGTDVLFGFLNAFISNAISPKDFDLKRKDPVRVVFAIRDTSNKLRRYEYWSHDLAKQPVEIQELKEVVDDIFERAKQLPSVRTKQLDAKSIKEWPDEFLPEPIGGS